MQLIQFRQLATRSALLLSLGLAVGSCDKAINVEPSNSISSDKGFSTKEDAAAGLLGAYDAMQSTSYYGLDFPVLADLVSQEIRHVGTFASTYGVINANQVNPDNVSVGTTWNAIYLAISRVNYLLQQSEKITDPAFPKLTTQGEARALRALHYMNLLGYWGGKPEGFGYTDGLGVPLRLSPTTSIGPETEAVPRASEAQVATAIRADLDFAIANLPSGAGGNRVTKNSALALRARFELWERNYADALKFAQQVPAVAGFATAAATGTTAPDAIWQLFFSNTDQSQYAFYWYPSPGGRNEFDPGSTLAAAHPTGDRRLPINVVAAATSVTVAGTPYTLSAGTTQKYYRTSSRDDRFNMVRYAEVVLTIAEAAAQTGDLATAITQLNIIRTRAGLAATTITPTTANAASALITDILLQRRLELAYEGHYWFDLRRTNRVQTALPTYTQSYRNLFPIPLREVQVTNGLIAQNPLY
ncbi:RagB/SusD family nutrient uptake outer membrane protein [Hymenobacter sp. BT770]|uniref:RagB/SusD family nutrient uptake outer membrane protein n=1 Tax=Hymenobacter sp. BT770 TaxID=2886942 RepID=UPI001D0F692B|nr:RagB/SusD family nutrient uptake outer membrane protein [Hymenobacter sp. BT770]MCC3152617.1 RagB/SusD family nutrient uptake outer membrane protein [Hymenobacter sp. BT770]MDO3414690.1 RagB/SusD family nutrient uptake outer membrane protein [Hymenobacter sp. BT770]